MTTPDIEGIERLPIYLPLSVKPLMDPTSDLGDRVILDRETAHIATVSSTAFAELAVRACNERAPLLAEVKRLRAREEVLASILRTARNQVVAFMLDNHTPEQALANVKYIDAALSPEAQS